MDKIYVIATTYEDTDLEMFHCYTSEETCNSIFNLAKEDCPDFRKPNPKDDPQDYLGEYYDYLWDDDFLGHKYNITLHIIDLKKEMLNINKLKQ